MKVSTKDIKVGRTPIWAYLEFICYIIVWNIWKLKKFLMCTFGFANLDICWSRLMAVFILLCCTLRIIFLNNSNNKSNPNFWLIFHIHVIWISNAWPSCLNRIKLSSDNKGQINHPISFLLKEPITSWIVYATWKEQTQV